MKILLIQLRRVGDVLLTTPVISAVKKAFPHASVDFLVEPGAKDVLLGNPGLNEILIYDKNKSWDEIKRIRSRQYDVVIDFLNNPRSSMLTFLSGAKWKVGFNAGPRSLMYNVRFKGDGKPVYVPVRKIQLLNYWLKKMGQAQIHYEAIRPQLFLQLDELDFFNNWRRHEKLDSDPFVVLAPIHRHALRQWRVEGFREVGLRLHRELGVKVYLTWGPGEEEKVNALRKGVEGELKLLPFTSLRQMAAIISQSKLVLTYDSGAMHVSVSVGTPTVTIYGPTRPIDWNPSLWDTSATFHDTVLTAPGVRCLGCHLNENCPVGHLCMKNMSDEMVFTACKRILKESVVL